MADTVFAPGLRVTGRKVDKYEYRDQVRSTRRALGHRSRGEGRLLRSVAAVSTDRMPWVDPGARLGCPCGRILPALEARIVQPQRSEQNRRVCTAARDGDPSGGTRSPHRPEIYRLAAGVSLLGELRCGAGERSDCRWRLDARPAVSPAQRSDQWHRHGDSRSGENQGALAQERLPRHGLGGSVDASSGFCLCDRLRRRCLAQYRVCNTGVDPFLCGENGSLS